MEISFIIVNYKSEKYLQKCVSSIRKKISDADYEIIVINNNQEIILEKLVLNADFLINTGKNIGFGAGCNAGVKVANGKILCFLNPDTEIIYGDINNLLNEFNKNDKLAIIGPKLLDEKNSIQKWIAGKEITITSILLNNLGYWRDKKIWESKCLINCAWVSGAALFIRKDIFNKLKGFDENFFMYFEDVDLCRRARNLGYAVLYYPDFIIKHFGGKSFLDKKKQKKYYRQSQAKYLKKHFL